MDFNAGHLNKEKGYWTSDTDPGSRFAPEFYSSDKYDDGSIPPPLNPKFDPDLNLTGASLGRGLDYFTNPATQSYVFTLKFGF